MYYLSRYTRETNSFYVMDTDDGVEECLNRNAIDMLMIAGVEVKGITAKIKHDFYKGDCVKLVKVEPYQPKVSKNSISVILYGFETSVTDDGTLLSMHPAKSIYTEPIVPSKFCKRLGVSSFTKDCNASDITYVLDESLEILDGFLSEFHNSPILCGFDIETLNNHEAFLVYKGIGNFVEDAHIKDLPIRRREMITYVHFLDGEYTDKDAYKLIANPRVHDKATSEVLAILPRVKLSLLPKESAYYHRYVWSAKKMIEKFERTPNEQLVESWEDFNLVSRYCKIFSVRSSKYITLMLNYIIAGGSNLDIKKKFIDCLNASFRR